MARENPPKFFIHLDVGFECDVIFSKEKERFYVFDNNGKFVQWDLWGFTEYNEWEGRLRSPLICERVVFSGLSTKYNNFFVRPVALCAFIIWLNSKEFSA